MLKKIILSTFSAYYILDTVQGAGVRRVNKKSGVPTFKAFIL